MERISLFCPWALLIAAFFLLPACSSLKRSAVEAWMGGARDRQAQKVRFAPPAPPYEKRPHGDLDALWWNPKAQSSLSYFSSCSSAPRSWEAFQKASLPVGEGVRLIKSERRDKGLYSLIEISSAGQKSQSAVYTTGKGSCLFNLNLVSPPAHFEEQLVLFEAFIQNFKPE